MTAQFDNIGGLKPQAAVKSAGVVVGRVESITFDDKNFQASVTLALESRYSFPKDSSLKILTSGLLGEQYIGIEAGADEKNLAAGDTITSTQSAVVLENLISQFLYSKAADGQLAARRQPTRNETTTIHSPSLCKAGSPVQLGAALLARLSCARAARPAPTPIRATRSSPSTAACRSFNERVDDAVLKPVATAYSEVLPSPVRTGVNNFFGNLSDVWSLRQQRAAVQAAGQRPKLHALQRQHDLRPRRHAGHRQRSRHRAPQRRLRPDAGPLGRADRAVPGAAAARPVDGARHGGAAGRLPGRPVSTT